MNYISHISLPFYFTVGQVGDGTTTVVLLAGQLLDQCKSLIEEGVHPHAIIRAFRRATTLAITKINEIAIKVSSYHTVLMLAMQIFMINLLACSQDNVDL